MTHTAANRGPMFREQPSLRPLLYVLTIKLRLILPLLWGFVKWLGAMRPVAFGVIGLLAIGVVEIKRHSLDLLSTSIRNCAVQEAYSASAEQINTYVNERWYELYLDAFAYLPGWLSYFANGKPSDIGAGIDDLAPAPRRWVSLGPEPGPAPYFVGVHVETANIARDATMWNFFWEAPPVGRLLLPWGWHATSVAKVAAPSASWRLRFLTINEAFGRYLANLNANHPRRTKWIDYLIQARLLHLTAADQAWAERDEDGNALSRPAKPVVNSNAAASSRAKPAGAVRVHFEAPVIVKIGFGVRFYPLTQAQAQMLERHRLLPFEYRDPEKLPAYTRIRRVLDANGKTDPRERRL